MNLSYKHLLPADFPSESRVWIYQSGRLFSIGEAVQIEEEIENFVSGWQSHGEGVRAFGNLFFGQFIILMADESSVSVGGCSTDSSVRFIKYLGEKYGVDFFNRQALAFVVKDKIELIPMNQVNYALENGFINSDTLYFNNVITSKKALDEQWIIPVGQSWLAARLMAK